MKDGLGGQSEDVAPGLDWYSLIGNARQRGQSVGPFAYSIPAAIISVRALLTASTGFELVRLSDRC